MFELGRAATAGDVAWVKTQLREGVQVNSRDSRGRTALHYACESEHKDMQRVVDVLLDAGADVNAQGKDGQTPLHVAVQRIPFHTKLENNAAGGENEGTPLANSSKRNEVLVKTLLHDGALVNVRDRKMRTALHYACESALHWLYDALHEGSTLDSHPHWACIYIREVKEGEKEPTPLQVAIDNNEILKALLAYSTNESSKDRLSQHLVNHPQDEDKIRMVNSRDQSGYTALHSSLTYDIIECVRLLLVCDTMGVIHFRGGAALHKAARYIVDILLNNGEDVNATDNYGNTPLHMASESGRTETVRLLLSKGAKVGVKNNTGETALHMAARYSRADIVDILLNNGEDVNATNKYGETPLHVASEKGRTETVRLLLSKGATVGFRNNTDKKALHMAASYGRADIVDILLNNGEDVNATNTSGDTLLHMASENCQTETVRLLLSKGAKVGLKNNAGETPLHKAADTIYAGDVIDVLVDQGEYVSAEDYYGNTPLHYLCKKAVMDNYQSVSHLSKAVFNINLLIIRGAKINKQNIQKNPSEIMKLRMKDVETTLITQAIRLKTLGLQDKFYISWILGQEFYDNVKFQCCQELEGMKSTIVVKDISLYQVLSHISQLFLVSTEDLQQIDEFLSSPDLLTRFPLYGDTLRITFQRAKLLTLAVQSFYSERRKQMMKRLPCEVTEQLVNFLSNKDLRMFIESE